MVRLAAFRAGIVHKRSKDMCPSLSGALCAYLQAGLGSARLSSVLADLEEDQRMAAWADC
jgi:hypothetical protein